MPNQGQAGGDPPNNCFTNQGVSSSGYTVIDIGGSPDVFDYVVPVLDEVDCRNALLAPQVGVIILDTDDDPGTECMGRRRNRAFYGGESSDNVNKALYNQMDLIGSYIIAGNFEEARMELNQIDQSTVEGIDAHFIGENLIQFYEGLDNNDNSNLVLNLKSIAMKEHPISGYAQAFHYYLTGAFADNLDLTFLENDEVGERQGDLKLNESPSKEITIFPNPADNHIRFTNSDKVLTLKVYSSVGELIHRSNALSILNTTNWTSGIYIFSIESIDGSSITKKILINK